MQADYAIHIVMSAGRLGSEREVELAVLRVLRTITTSTTLGVLVLVKPRSSYCWYLLVELRTAGTGASSS